LPDGSTLGDSPHPNPSPEGEGLKAAFLARFLSLAFLLTPQAAFARPVVEASAPQRLAVSVYRDPYAGPDDAMNPEWLEGYALVSETRTVTLPPGTSTVRFAGVVGGMVAVSAIVTGLPGGTIEKNRNAALLSPASLVDGTLGNRVTITRTNPATGKAVSEPAVIRTRADGGLVLQTQAGFEAIGCAGVPETLGFERVPDGLLPVPVYSIDTSTPAGGTYTVQLTYLASGFDWRANYVATFAPGAGSARKLHLTAWLTVANENSEGLPMAELMAVAGKLQVESDFRSLADAPVAEPLRLTCYPLAIAGFPGPPEMIPYPPPPPPPMVAMPAPEMMMDIVVTANRVESRAPVTAVTAEQENLGDLKLYRVPVAVDVAAKGQKQVAFFNQSGIAGDLRHRGSCFGNDADSMDPQDEWDLAETAFNPLGYLFRAKNDKAHGLGIALPMGKVAVFEDLGSDDYLLGEDTIRDYAVSEDVELELGESPAVFLRCTNLPGESIWDGKWHQLRAELTNANASEVVAELALGSAGEWDLRGVPGKVYFRNGTQTVDIRVRPGERKVVTWKVRAAD
jgi:hypothetical protein